MRGLVSDDSVAGRRTTYLGLASLTFMLGNTDLVKKAM